MQKIHTTIPINAPREKVWHTMLDDQSYREWTKAFHEGSYYQGKWEAGSEMLFLGPSEDGSGEGGMFSRIAESRPHEFISIQHLGIIKNGQKDTTSDEAKKWAPAFENYTFTEKNGVTEVAVDMDVEDEYKAMFEEMWAKALQALRELAERPTT
jgi:hypothetical protein